jgi:O-antigen/teichoic acid export membrane protein
MGTGRNHFLSHAAIYLVARGLPGIVAFLAIPLFSRLLTPDDYGRYAMVVAIVGLLNALLFQWLRLSLVRYMPAFRDDPAKLKSTLLTVALAVIGTTALVAALACVLPWGREHRGIIGAAWLLLAVMSLFELASEYARAVVRPWRNMVFQVMRAASFVGAGSVFVLLGWTWQGPIAGMVAGMAVAVVVAWRADWRSVRLGIDRDLLRTLANYGLPLSVTVALAVVIGTSDRFLIDLYLGDSAAGLYAVAVDFTSQSLTLLMMVINLAMFPLAVRAWEEHGPVAAKEQMRNNASMLMAVGLPCVAGMTVLAPGIAHCFLGEQFRDAAVDIIPLVALGAFLAGLKAYHFDAAFQFVHKTIYQVWIVLFVAIVNVVLNVIAIPRWGINGSAVASLAAYGLSIALTAWLGRRHLALPFPPVECLRVGLACAVMAVSLWSFRDNTAPLAVSLQIAGGALVYGVVLIGTDFVGLGGAVLRRVRRPGKSEAVIADDDVVVAVEPAMAGPALVETR